MTEDSSSNLPRFIDANFGPTLDDQMKTDINKHINELTEITHKVLEAENKPELMASLNIERVTKFIKDKLGEDFDIPKIYMVNESDRDSVAKKLTDAGIVINFEKGTKGGLIPLENIIVIFHDQSMPDIFTESVIVHEAMHSAGVRYISSRATPIGNGHANINYETSLVGLTNARTSFGSFFEEAYVQNEASNYYYLNIENDVKAQQNLSKMLNTDITDNFDLFALVRHQSLSFTKKDKYGNSVNISLKPKSVVANNDGKIYTSNSICFADCYQSIKWALEEKDFDLNALVEAARKEPKKVNELRKSVDSVFGKGTYLRLQSCKYPNTTIEDLAFVEKIKKQSEDIYGINSRFANRWN